MNSKDLQDKLHGTEVAIIGMAGRFPRAKDVEAFWENLRAGVDAVTFFKEEELLAAGVEESLLQNPNYVRARMVLEGADLFDAAFFGYPPREAELMDPQHRLFLETARAAVEHAGHVPEKYRGLIGVFAGAGFPHYFINNIISNHQVLELMGMLQATLGNESDSLASKVSYKLDLKGPSIGVQTFCSTSLVAVHLACQSLLSFECDMVLAGGVAVDSSQNTGYLYQPGGIASPDGHCRTFDAKAQGSIYGSGVGVVVLKRLVDAITDKARSMPSSEDRRRTMTGRCAWDIPRRDLRARVRWSWKRWRLPEWRVDRSVISRHTGPRHLWATPSSWRL